MMNTKSNTDKYDVVVIGGGSAGYVAAIRCAQLGKKTACVDNWVNSNEKPALGGTCLNVGCIPSKALLESSEKFEQLQQEYAAHGIHCNGVEVNITEMQARKDKVVTDLTSGIELLFQANKIDRFFGRGKLLSDSEVEIKHADKRETIKTKKIIIATGSSPVELDIAPLDNNKIVDSTGALCFDEVPKKLGVIGSGVIGLELGSVWRRLGADVVVLEALDEFLPITDQQISKDALKEFKRQGLDIRLNARLMSAEVKKEKVEVHYQHEEQDHKVMLDKLIVAVGRRPNSENLCAGDLDLVLDEGGFIHVNSKCETSLPGVYAIGDVVRGPMLAHKGSEEGIMVAELIAGNHGHMNYDLIPSVIYTDPEIAWVGKTEQQLKSMDIPYNVGAFPFLANGRARALGNTKGMVKILSHAETDRVLGMHIMGPQASELIAQAVIAMEFGASSEDLAMMIFAHPTLAESVHEAALAVSGQAIHIAQRRSKLKKK